MIRRLACLLLVACLGCEAETHSPDSPSPSKSPETTTASSDESVSSSPKTATASASRMKSADGTESPPRKQKANPAPDFTLVDLGGTNVKLSEFRGKVVLRNFWGGG